MKVSFEARGYSRKGCLTVSLTWSLRFSSFYICSNTLPHHRAGLWVDLEIRRVKPLPVYGGRDVHICGPGAIAE